MTHRRLNRIFILAICLALPWLVYGQKQSAPGKDRFVVAYSEELFIGINLNDVQAAVDMWTNELEEGINKKLGTHYNAKSVFIKKDEDLQISLSEIKPDVMTINSLSFLKIRNSKKYKPIFCGDGMAGHTGKTLVLLTRTSSNYRTIKDLQGKTIAFPKNKQFRQIEMWLDNLVLKEQKLVYTKFFKSIQNPSRGSKAVLDLFFAKTDACVVSKNIFLTMSELNPQISRSIQIIKQSEPMIFTVVCLNQDLDEPIQQEVYKLAKSLALKVKGRQILKLFGTSVVTDYKPEFLQSVVNLKLNHDRLIKNIHKN